MNRSALRTSDLPRRGQDLFTVCKRSHPPHRSFANTTPIMPKGHQRSSASYGRWLWLGRPCSDGTATHPTQHSSQRVFNLQQDCSVVSGVLEAAGWSTVIEDAATRSLFQRLQVIQLPSQGLCL
ncbi:Basic leucine zipper 24 [Zea mays]|uniref:Basic leucine zipper 24 n=1 Tax=Zea mays TaxID=4577 RepID=A0A1D6M7B2_MAIZE|nr:Basic leucine zipper 24 [Zea mays]